MTHVNTFTKKTIPLGRQHHKTEFQIGPIFQRLFNQPPKFVRETNRNYHELPNTRFINYMSFGLDATVVLDFHDQRTSDPSINKAAFTYPRIAAS
jgi:hypothetical protein